MQNGRQWGATGRLCFTKTDRTDYPCLISHTQGAAKGERIVTAFLTSSCISHFLQRHSIGKVTVVIIYFFHSPFSSTARTQAPLASSSSTTTFKPLRAATWRGLKKEHGTSAGIRICVSRCQLGSLCC